MDGRAPAHPNTLRPVAIVVYHLQPEQSKRQITPEHGVINLMHHNGAISLMSYNMVTQCYPLPGSGFPYRYVRYELGEILALVNQWPKETNEHSKRGVDFVIWGEIHLQCSKLTVIIIYVHIYTIQSHLVYPHTGLQGFW